jgi:hypothetical protein
MSCHVTVTMTEVKGIYMVYIHGMEDQFNF